MIEQTRLGHLECWPLWALDDKIISVLVVVGHYIIIMNQDEGQDVGYSLGIIPDRIGIPGEVTNVFGVCHSRVTMET